VQIKVVVMPMMILYADVVSRIARGPFTFIPSTEVISGIKIPFAKFPPPPKYKCGVHFKPIMQVLTTRFISNHSVSPDKIPKTISLHQLSFSPPIIQLNSPELRGSVSVSPYPPLTPPSDYSSPMMMMNSSSEDDKELSSLKIKGVISEEREEDFILKDVGNVDDVLNEKNNMIEKEVEMNEEIIRLVEREKTNKEGVINQEEKNTLKEVEIRKKRRLTEGELVEIQEEKNMIEEAKIKEKKRLVKEEEDINQEEKNTTEEIKIKRRLTDGELVVSQKEKNLIEEVKIKEEKRFVKEEKVINQEEKNSIEEEVKIKENQGLIDFDKMEGEESEEEKKNGIEKKENDDKGDKKNEYKNGEDKEKEYKNKEKNKKLKPHMSEVGEEESPSSSSSSFISSTLPSLLIIDDKMGPSSPELSNFPAFSPKVSEDDMNSFEDSGFLSILKNVFSPLLLLMPVRTGVSHPGVTYIYVFNILV
jgi:hypothetical protein